jgi:tripartite-type tricarboxylate transporter receptor subunit TctC
MIKLFYALLISVICNISYAESDIYKFIIPTGPGSGSDNTLEIYRQCFESQGISVVKEFKPGAEGLVAVRALQNSTDTKNTINILLGNFGLNALSNFQGIDYLNDIHPLTYLSFFHMVIAGKAENQLTIAKLKEMSKIKPITVGSPNTSSAFIVEHLFKDLGIPHEVINYNVMSQALVDVIGGNLDIIVNPYIGTLPMLEQKKLSIITSTFDSKTAEQKGHLNMYYYSNKLEKMPLGLILSSKPMLDDVYRQKLIKTVLTCNKNDQIKDKLESSGAYPAFVNTKEVRQIIKTAREK